MRKITDGRLGRQSQSGDPVNGESEHPPAIRAALAIAAQYPVFPCDPSTKRPITSHGFKDATQEPHTVVGWWRRYPHALIGVPTGSASGLLAIDCDPKGARWYWEQGGRLGEHRLHGTRRGKHLLYHYPTGETIGNSASQVAPGVDVRGEGGYIIWWPAHGGVSVGEPGELPDWLVRAVRKGSSARKVNGHALDSAQEADGRDTRKFKEGERGVALSNRAYHYRKMGLSTREIAQALLQYDLEHCEPPYQHTDGKAKVRYIARKKEHILSDGEVAAHTEVELKRADEIEEVPVDWLWKGILARNKLHLLSGAGGSMKSTLTLHMAAIVSRGGKWPDGSRCPRGNVIIWTGEDDLNDTVRPRLRYAGADLERCYFVDAVREEGKKRSFNPAQDIPKLAKACAGIGDVSLIIIDPAVSVVQRDSNSASEVRRGLDPLFALGHQYHAAIIGIHHLNKGSKGRTPGERVTGSGAWTQAPRLSLMVAAVDAGDDKVPDKWVFVCEKTFSKGRGGGYEYGFEEEPETEITRIVWGRRLEGSAQSILAEAEGTESDGSKIGAAVKFLQKILADGSVSVWDIDKQAKEAEIRGITLRRAKELLKVETLRTGKNSYRWVLPEEEPRVHLAK